MASLFEAISTTFVSRDMSWRPRGNWILAFMLSSRKQNGDANRKPIGLTVIHESFLIYIPNPADIRRCA